MRGKRTGWLFRAGCAAAIGILSLCLGGCSVTETLFSGGNEQEEYGRAETMMVVSSEKLRYEELYTEQIWTAAVDNRGTTFEASLLAQIHEFLRELRVMSRMAEEQEIVLTSQEQELIQEAAVSYCTALGEANMESFGLDEKTAGEFYTDYLLAQKLVDQLTQGANLEVSDSEARVITVDEIQVSSEETANEALTALSAEDSDFTAVAKQYSESEEIQTQVYRGQRGAAYEEAAFNLTAGKVSGVVEDGGTYYIIRCVSDYDEAATKERKEQMVKQRKNEAFYQAYEDYKTQLLLVGDDVLWEELSILECPEVSADFFAVYETVFSGSQA